VTTRLPEQPNRPRPGPGNGPPPGPPPPDASQVAAEARPEVAAAGAGADGGDERAATRSLGRSTLIMTAGTALSRVTGLLRTMALIAFLGVVETPLADTYNTANITPNILYELVLGGILSSIFVPVFVQARQEDGKEAAWRLARVVLTVTGVGLTVLVLLVMLTSEWAMRLYTIGVDDPAVRADQIRVGGQLLVLFAPQILFYGLGTVMTGLLNANRRFGVPMFAPVLNNLVVIAAMFVYYLLVDGAARSLDDLSSTEVLVLGLGTTAGVVAMTLVQVPFLRRAGLRFRPVWDLRHPALRKMAKMGAFTFGFVVTNQLAYMAVLVLSGSVRGGYTAYANALQYFQLPHGLFAVSVMTALLPPMSEQALARNWPAFRRSIARGLRLTTFVLLPATVGYLVLAGPIVRLLSSYGVITEQSLNLLTLVVTMFVLGLVSFSTYQLALRAFYALQDTRSPFQVNLVTAVVRVVVGIALFSALPTDEWKIGGLALAYGVSYTVGSVVLLAMVRRRIGGLDGWRTVDALVRILAASLFMGAAALAASALAGLVVPPGFLRDLLSVVAGMGAGVGVYLLLAKALRIEELEAVKAVVRRRGARA
jgi:putative peptidoglycan lipid II flippase